MSKETFCLRLFEAQAATGESEEAASSDAGENKESSHETFEKLIKGEYKEAFAARTQSIIDKRFKEHKTMQSKLEKVEPLLRRLGEQYGVENADVDTLLAAMTKKSTQEFLQTGEQPQTDVEDNHTVQPEEMPGQSPVMNGAKDIYAGWLQEAEALTQIYPMFSLDAERQNPKFVGLLKGGATLQEAYEVIHRDEVLGGAMRYTAEQVSKKMAAGIAAKTARPQENGSSHATAVLKNSPASMTKSEREAIARRVMRGETIRF